MISQDKFGSNLLAVTSIGISLIAVYSIFDSSVGNRNVSAFVFPDRIPLKSWQQKDSKSLNRTSKPKKNEAIVKSGKSYSYNKNNTDLEIEMRYVVGTKGNISEYFQKYTDLTLKESDTRNIKHIENIGFYALFTSGNRLYLSSCINPRGNSSVTREHFFHNLNNIDWQAISWNWLVGKASINDHRCLWTHLSTSIEPTQPQIAHQILEQAWTDWYLWWHPRFPSL